MLQRNTGVLRLKWRAQAEATTRLLTDQREQVRRPWWRRWM
jgi:hypothetical protein